MDQKNSKTPNEEAEQGIHIVAKPIGPVCNLNCEYCFYLEKKALFSAGEQYRMTDEVLRAYIANYITSQPTPVVEFVWQGGEPTLLGLDFFRRVIELQKPFAGRKTITNSLQTNGTLLTDKCCAFLKEHNFMVGISLDGPKEVHDRYRRDRKGNGTFDRVMRGLKLLQKHEVEYNVLACVARDTAKRPLDVYRFFKGEGIEFIQFIPIVERMPDVNSTHLGLRLAGPAALEKVEQHFDVTPWTVIPEEYGDFLIAIYEEWVRHDVGKVFVMNFEWALNAWIGNPSPICVHAKQCGQSLVIEHNGDVFACDHCVYPQYRLGNIMTSAGVLAQGAEGGSSPTEPGVKTSSATPEPTSYLQDLLTREKLTGNWGGVREELAKKGITFDVDLTQVLQGNVSGGNRFQKNPQNPWGGGRAREPYPLPGTHQLCPPP